MKIIQSCLISFIPKQYTSHSCDFLTNYFILAHILHAGLGIITLFILIDFPMYVDRISMELSILYFKGSKVEFSKSYCISYSIAIFIQKLSVFMNISKKPRYPF